MKMWVLYASEDRMVGPVGFRIRTVGVCGASSLGGWRNDIVSHTMSIAA